MHAKGTPKGTHTHLLDVDALRLHLPLENTSDDHQLSSLQRRPPQPGDVVVDVGKKKTPNR